MDMITLILIIPICSQVCNSPMSIKNKAVISALYVDGVGDCLALHKMSDIHSILGVDPQIGLLEGIKLLLAEEGYFA